MEMQMELFMPILRSLDGDGDQDVLSASIVNPNDGVSWYQNDGQQNFTEILIDAGQESVVASDFDGDGDMDVISSGGTVSWFENNGTGTFTKHAVTTVDNGARRALVVDLNQDGHNDILVASQSDQTLSWYENDGSGGLVRKSSQTQ